MKENLYLVVTIYHQPKKGLRTEKSTIYDEPDKGRRTKDTSWTLNPHAWNDIEVPELVSRISPKRMRAASVIIDVINDKLVKNRFSKNDPADILAHFKKKFLSEYLSAIEAARAAAENPDKESEAVTETAEETTTSV